jgi:hypothetical protein
MPDKRAHRGPHPEDGRLFAESQWPVLRQAVGHLSWLLTRGYAEKSALKLVGDHFLLNERQRTAVMRCSCSDQSLSRRQTHEVSPEAVAGRELLIDGYNVLTTLEAALAGGVLIQGRDGCVRDMASMHGTFRKVRETLPALGLIGEFLAALQVQRCRWLLDSPVSNSGRLRGDIQRFAEARGWPWEVELLISPDAVLSKADSVVATADSVVLDRCGEWFNLARRVVAEALPEASILCLEPE